MPVWKSLIITQYLKEDVYKNSFKCKKLPRYVDFSMTNNV